MSVHTEILAEWRALLPAERLHAALGAAWRPQTWGGEWQALRKPGLGRRERWRWLTPPMTIRTTQAPPAGAAPLSAPQPSETVLFVKRYGPATWRETWDRLWRQSARMSRARWEYHCSDELTRKYVPVVRAVAAADRMALGWECASVAVFERARGAPLDQLLRQALHENRPIVRGPARHDLARRIGRFVSAFHQTGLCHRDLYLCHIFAELDLDARVPPGFTLIDLARVHRPGWFRFRWLVKDLAQLDSSARMLGVMRTDRLRCLLAYLGLQYRSPRARLYARRISRKSDWIVRREVEHQARRG